MITTNDFKRGLLVEIDAQPYQILDVSFHTPTARGANTIVKVKLRNMLNGQFANKTYRAGEAFKEPDFQRRAVQYLYSDGTDYHFMDQESYEQFGLSGDVLGDQALYLHDGIEGVQAYVYNGETVGIELPASVVLRVEQTDPALRGATATAQTKPATLETGLVVQVPPYMESGETVRVDTRTGQFLERVRK